MIFESYPWKLELARHARSIKTWLGKSHTGRGYFNIERAVFLSAFIVRKLIENRKVTDRIRDRTMRCLAYRPFRPLSDRVSRFHGIYSVEKEYDVSNGEETQLSLPDLASVVMHSYVFVPEVDDSNSVVAFLVNSYRERDDRLLRVELSGYLEALELIVADDVQQVRVWKDPSTGRIHATHD